MDKGITTSFSLFLKNLCFCLLFSLLSYHVIAQNKAQVKLLGADRLLSAERNGQEAQRLIGNVRFQHQDALIYCDSAYYYAAMNFIEAFGSVRINQNDTFNLYGDYLDYRGDTRIAHIKGEEVRLETNNFTLFTNQLNYNRELNIATYLNSGRIIGKKDSNILVSKKGYYNAYQQSFTFKDSVELYNPDFKMFSDTLKYYTTNKWVEFLGPTEILGDSNLIYCEKGWYDTNNDQSEYYDNAYLISENRRLEGDTLFYDRKLGYGIAKGNVEIIDTTEHIILNGQLAKMYEYKDSVLVTDYCYLTQKLEDDSLFMRADTFKINKDKSGEKLMYAYNGVRIFKSDLQAICDSIAYSFSDSVIQLYEDPVMWSKKSQMTADRIDIRTIDNKIHSIYLDQNAFLIEEVDSIHYNQIKGKVMTGYFKKSKLSLMEIRGNGQTIYYGLDEKNKFIGVNDLESSDIDIRMRDNEIKAIKYLNQPIGTMHPMGELDPVTELRYEGFAWRILERPLEKSSVINFDQ